ncbi:MAG: class I SAM-dependent DNA methyltransferase [Pseudorhodobacter sp.]
MTAGKHGGHLGRVYAAQAPDEIAASYDDWAESYEAQMRAAGYRHPSVALALLARHLPKGEGPILDAGAGTGMVGEWLAIVGYPDMEALDISRGMLDVAKRKGCYRALHRCALGEKLPFADGYFAGVISTGVFTTGHVGAEALPELLRSTRTDGILILTVKDTVWHGGFEAAIKDLVTAGRIAVLEESVPYISMPGEKDTIPGRALAIRVRG